jgi:deoxycytidine triphosphate deaminase
LRSFTDRYPYCSTDLPTADERYKLLETIDPYPEIPPSLLHSGHLASYAVMTGMIEPFDLAALQKPATYLVPLEGPVRYRDTKGQYQRFYLSSDPTVRNVELDVRSELILEQNSLCYVSLQPTFRMPAYIAGRFNLLIRDVYRGLLVGTGPLVDPGFMGRLSIPLHNFTSNEYPLMAGEGFVYFEFTKLSWTNGDQPRATASWLKPPIAVQPPFPGSKNARRTIDDYLSPATHGLPAENAVGTEIRRLSGTSEEIARMTETIAQRTQFFTVAGFAGIVGLVIVTLAAVITGWQVYLGAQQVVQAAKADTDNAAGKTADLLQRSKLEFNAALEALQKRTVTPEQVQALQSQLDQTRQAIRDLESRVPSAGGTPHSPAKH